MAYLRIEVKPRSEPEPAAILRGSKQLGDAWADQVTYALRTRPHTPAVYTWIELYDSGRLVRRRG